MKKFFQSKGFIVTSLTVLCVAILGVCWFASRDCTEDFKPEESPPSSTTSDWSDGGTQTDGESGAGAYTPGQSSSPEEEYRKVTSETEDETRDRLHGHGETGKHAPRPRQKGKPSGKTPVKIIRSILTRKCPRSPLPLRKRSRPITSRPRSQQWQRRCV